ncbi:MAG: HEPN domain-containing protein [Candidatus Roizmanbacteria bacterium]|nr:HEPN domain-containing protein [Candidatus Roizmanbacteria bacterium]
MTNYREHASEWFAIADDDLAYANVGLKEDDFYSLIAFHAQQAAEKYLKGFLVLHGIKPLYSHDLSILIKECAKLDPTFTEIASEADILSPFAVDIRYPVYYSSISSAQANKAVSCAEVVKIFIRERANKKA